MLRSMVRAIYPYFVEMDKVKIIEVDNPAREGLVSLVVDGLNSADVVKKLNEQGSERICAKLIIILETFGPLGLDGCTGVHVTTIVNEVAQFLAAMKTIAA